MASLYMLLGPISIPAVQFEIMYDAYMYLQHQSSSFHGILNVASWYVMSRLWIIIIITQS